MRAVNLLSRESITAMAMMQPLASSSRANNVLVFFEVGK
jgi:hypothetical protein